MAKKASSNTVVLSLEGKDQDNLIKKAIRKFKKSPDKMSHQEIDRLPIHVLVPNVGYTHSTINGRLRDTRAMA